ncbi:hypothetical protein KKA14_02080 [bacterium]|nr:hypothetical protein [bacterium]
MEYTPKAIFFAMPQPDTELLEISAEVERIAERDPMILKLIAADQDQHAKEEEKKRIEDNQYRQTGRKRMAPNIVLFFLILRGYIGGFKAKATQTFVKESMTIHNFLERNGIRMPGWSTIVDNVNQVSYRTRSYILDSHLASVLGERLDDFEKEMVKVNLVVARVDLQPTRLSRLARIVEIQDS